MRQSSANLIYALFYQLVLAPESRYITTFYIHKGLKRYKRLNFGTSSAAEIFRHAIQQALEGVHGALNISDDIIIFGKTTSEHDLALEQTFQRLSEKGLTLNPSKCVFDKDHLDFFGYTLSNKRCISTKQRSRTEKFSWYRQLRLPFYT